MSAHAPLRLGVIGGSLASAVGYTHFVSARMDGNFAYVAGAYSRDARMNAESGAAYGVEPGRTYARWQDMIEREGSAIDAVLVLTPIPTHCEIVIRLLQSGVPVICEKALAASSAECARIGEVVAAFRGFLVVTFNYYGYTIVRELRRIIADGLLGTIQQIHIEMPQEGFLRRSASGAHATPQAWRLADGVVPTVSLDLGAHVHHLVRFLVPGERPLAAVADEATYGNFRGIVDNVYGIVRYSGGMRVQTWFGKTALGRRNGLRIRVFGSEGAAEWFQLEPENLRLWSFDGAESVIDRSSASAVVAGARRYNRFKVGHPDGFLEAFANVYADIADALRTHLAGESPSIAYVSDAAHAEEGLQLLETLANAARSRSWQSFGGQGA